MANRKGRWPPVWARPFPPFSRGSPARPADGQLSTVGKLRFPTNGYVGFDIDGQSGAAFASLTRDGVPSILFSVNLKTGRVTRIGRIGNASPLVGIAVAR